MPVPPVRRASRTTALTVAAALTAAGQLALSAPAAAEDDCSANGISVSSLNAPVFYTDLDASPQLDSGYAGYRVTSSDARRNLWVRLAGFGGDVLVPVSQQPDAQPLGDLAAGASAPSFFLLTSSTLTSHAQSHDVQVFSGNPALGSSTLLCSSTGGFLGVQDTIQAAANKITDVDGDGRVVTLSTGAPILGGSFSISVEGDTGTVGAGTAQDPNGLYMTPTALRGWPAGAFRLTGTSLRMSPDGTAAPQTRTDLLRWAPLGAGARDYIATYTFTITGTTSTPNSVFPIQNIASGTQIKHTNTSNFGDASINPPIPVATNPLTVSVDSDSATLPSTGGTVTYTVALTSTAAATSTLDSLVAQLPDGVEVVSGSARYNGAVVTDPAHEAFGERSFAGPFPVSSGAPGTLTFDAQIPGVPDDYAVSAYGLLAATVVDTTSGTGDAAPDGAVVTVEAPGTEVPPHTEVPQTEVPQTEAPGAQPLPQTIDFAPLADTRLGAPAPALTATATSQLPVSYTAGPAEVCTVAAGVLTTTGAGTCTVVAGQAGDDGFDAAADVPRSFEVLRRTQALDVPALPDRTVGDAPLLLSAEASSGLPVSWKAGPSDVCTASSGSQEDALTAVGPGTCSVTASQEGDSTHEPAAPVTRTLQVLPAPVEPPVVDIPTVDVPTVDVPAVVVPAPPGPEVSVPAPVTPVPAPPSPPVRLVPVTRSVGTVGTSPGTAELRGLPAGAVVAVAADVARTVRGVGAVTVRGTTVRVTPDRGFSGLIRLPVRITVGSQSAASMVLVTVDPAVPTGARRTLGPDTGKADTSEVRWTASPAAESYEVRVRGRLACRTAGTSCPVPGLLGPRTPVTLVALGREGTRSTTVPVGYRPDRTVRVLDVHFATDSARLDATARARLDRTAALMRREGFGVLHLSGHTDSRADAAYNTALSQRRARAVRRHLTEALAGTGIDLAVSSHASTQPAASNRTAAGRAANRRVEVSLG